MLVPSIEILISNNQKRNLLGQKAKKDINENFLTWDQRFAEEIKRPEYSSYSFNYNIIKHKWKHTGSFKGEGAVQVMILKKDQWILYCALFLGDTECWLA